MQPVSYCGAPPVPGAVAWNLDPVLLGCLLAVGLGYVALARHKGVPRGRRFFFLAGWSVIVAALISPLCNLSVALFSARIGQHMLIEFMAVPLCAYGLFGTGLGPRGHGLRPALGGAALFAAALWFWHLPGPYDWTFRSEAAYWSMHLSLGLSALLLWRSLLDSRQPSASLIASGFTSIQMTVLGAIYTFAGRPFFAVHYGTTGVWGLTPLEDQQLGGLLMWIPPGLALAGLAAWTMAAMLSTQERLPAHDT